MGMRFGLLTTIVWLSFSTFNLYLFPGAAAAVTMGLGYYMTSKTTGKIDPLVDPNAQTIKLQVNLPFSCLNGFSQVVV